MKEKVSIRHAAFQFHFFALCSSLPPLAGSVIAFGHSARWHLGVESRLADSESVLPSPIDLVVIRRAFARALVEDEDQVALPDGCEGVRGE